MRRFEVVREDMRRTNGKIKLPKRATKNSVAYDFYSPTNYIIKPKQTLLIFTDVKARFNSDEALLLNVRSSMGKSKIMLGNTQGWVESDFCDNETTDGNIGFMLYNYGETNYVIMEGDRIGQGMFIKYLTTDDDNANEVRIGGFGSTNK